jgi:perosamine synthetase
MKGELIPVCRPVMAGREHEYVSDAVRSGWISSAGQYLTKFEAAFARFAGCDHGVGCSNGTAAVHLALLAAGVRAGDRVVVPSFTMMASVFPILIQGAEPVFVDCDPETWTLDPRALESVRGSVKAVMPVHIYGHPCDMDPIREWAAARDVIVIEDAAEAHGATYRGRAAGSLGQLAAFSFYANKIITCGEGGMVTTNDAALAERARYYRNLCFDKDPAKRFIHEDVGYNFRLTNVQAAIGLAQTEEAERLVAMRRGMAKKYLERLASLSDRIELPAEKPWARNSYWMFGIVLRDGVRMDAAEAQKRLADAGVDTRRFFFPGHLQPILRDRCAQVSAPVSERLWNRGIYLPSSSDLTDGEADRVLDALRQVVEAS